MANEIKSTENKSATKLEKQPGNTSFDDVVVAKIAGIATREVSGVYDLGGGFDRIAGTVRDFIPGNNTNVTQGIEVEVGERQAAVDVTLIAEYGVAIHELASAVRQNIISSIERMTGLEVTEVNVDIIDVHTDYQTPQEREEAERKEREERQKSLREERKAAIEAKKEAEESAPRVQ